MAFRLDLDLPDELLEDPGFLKVYCSADDIIWWSSVCVLALSMTVDTDQHDIQDVYSFKGNTTKDMVGAIS